MMAMDETIEMGPLEIAANASPEEWNRAYHAVLKKAQARLTAVKHKLDQAGNHSITFGLEVRPLTKQERWHDRDVIRAERKRQRQAKKRGR